MGPPPPPPPPPPLGSAAPLSSGGWKAANAPRRNNNPAPAPPPQTRPRVDSAALQHAAARLRKTGYNEQIRGDVPNLSNGGMDGENQQLPGRDRSHSTQQRELVLNQTGEQVYATPSGAGNSDSLGNVCRHPDPVNRALPPEPRRDSFDSVPKNLFQTFNNPASASFIDNSLHTEALQSARQPSPSSAPRYSSDAFNVARATIAQHLPLKRSQSPAQSPAQTSYSSYKSSIQNSYEPSRATSSPRPASPVRPAPSYATITPVANSINGYQPTNYSSASSSTSNPNYSSSTQTFNEQGPNFNSQTTVTKTNAFEPMVGGNRSSFSTSTSTRSTSLGGDASWNPSVRGPSPILDPQTRIHNFATQNYVQEKAPPPTQSYNGSRDSIPRGSINSQQKPYNFAQELRDQGLTASQKQANLNRTPQRRADDLPFDANRLYQQSYRGDEVDNLVHRMQSQMSTATTRRTNVMQDSNICVACNSEINIDKPGCTALDQIFHVACFKCVKCSKVLAGSTFYNLDNSPICEVCYVDTLDRCSKCNQPISDKLLRACGGTYHVECFTCIVCCKPLDGIPFTVDASNSPHCVPCFHEKFAPRCAMCSQGIVPKDGEKESVRVVAMDKSFHVECYKCEDCGLQLSSKIEGQGCYPLDSHLYCKTCNSNRLRMMATA